jgi:hemerythrin-like metal-binding protein
MEIGWEPSMSVGEETIDSQHKKLLTQINKLIQILPSLDVNMAQLRETIHFLYDYIKEHFNYEEKYMAENNFPGLEVHKGIHQKFVQFYEDFQKELKEKITSKNFSSVEIKELLKKAKKYLSDWLIHHIKGIDQEYAKYIRSHSK